MELIDYWETPEHCQAVFLPRPRIAGAGADATRAEPLPSSHPY
jgi:hypothetical protein